MTDAHPGVSGDEALEQFYAALLDDDAEALYEKAPCGYLSTTPDGTIVKVNETFLTWSGYRRGDLVGRRTFAELLTPGGRIYHETHFAPMLRMQGTVREIAVDVVGCDGRRLPVLVNAVLERDEQGAPLVVRTALFDATERRQYERELLRAKQLAEESEQRAVLLARTLQQTLIPPAPPVVDGLDVAAAYRPAGSGEEVGGDFYDVFELADGEWAVAVGDVQGKGVDAAVVTALARYTIRAAAVRQRQPSEALATLNDVLLGHPSGRFCTVVLARLRRVGRRWVGALASGGHPPPLLCPAGGAPSWVPCAGRLLGVLPLIDVDDVPLSLEPGDALVLYTDGVTEARRGGELFGEARLAAAAARHAGSAASIVDGLRDDVLAFQSGVPRDDIVIVAVGGPAPPGQGAVPKTTSAVTGPPPLWQANT